MTSSWSRGPFYEETVKRRCDWFGCYLKHVSWSLEMTFETAPFVGLKLRKVVVTTPLLLDNT